MKKVHLEELLLTKLGALYDMEKQIAVALPKMATAATNPDLKKGFEDHLGQTLNQIGRLEESFDLLGVKPKAIHGEAIRGIIADAENIIKNIRPPEVLDANLVRAAQYVEHYEMAGYHGAICWADILGYTEVGDLLETNLSEEITTDEKLDALGEKTDPEAVEEK